MEKLINRKPSMAQMMAILKEWFVSVSGDTSGSIDLKEIGWLIVEKGLVSDVDSA